MSDCSWYDCFVKIRPSSSGHQMKDEVEKLIAILTEYDQMKIPVFTENITADKAITNSKKIDLAREYAAARILKLRETAQVEAVRAAQEKLIANYGGNNFEVSDAMNNVRLLPCVPVSAIQFELDCLAKEDGETK